MIISMKRGAPKEQVDHICERIENFGYKVHSIQGDERVVIAAIGIGDVTHALESLESSEWVESAVPISAPYKTVSREVKSEHTIVPVGEGRSFGGDDFVMIGIHTPETAAERVTETVRKKAAAEKLLYPIVIDGKSENWNAWGNSMWPSVYLVDKRGYLRYFWPGELKWQGQDGEAYLQARMEELLAEEAD